MRSKSTNRVIIDVCAASIYPRVVLKSNLEASHIEIFVRRLKHKKLQHDQVLSSYVLCRQSHRNVPKIAIRGSNQSHPPFNNPTVFWASFRGKGCHRSRHIYIIMVNNQLTSKLISGYSWPLSHQQMFICALVVCPVWTVVTVRSTQKTKGKTGLNSPKKAL